VYQLAATSGQATLSALASRAPPHCHHLARPAQVMASLLRHLSNQESRRTAQPFIKCAPATLAPAFQVKPTSASPTFTPGILPSARHAMRYGPATTSASTLSLERVHPPLPAVAMASQPLRRQHQAWWAIAIGSTSCIQVTHVRRLRHGMALRRRRLLHGMMSEAIAQSCG
jgi:hypothetical protein